MGPFCYNKSMTKAERKVLKNADKALVEALMDLIEMQSDCNSEKLREIAAENVWRKICHARSTLALVLEGGPNE